MSNDEIVAGRSVGQMIRRLLPQIRIAVPAFSLRDFRKIEEQVEEGPHVTKDELLSLFHKDLKRSRQTFSEVEKKTVCFDHRIDLQAAA